MRPDVWSCYDVTIEICCTACAQSVSSAVMPQQQMALTGKELQGMTWVFCHRSPPEHVGRYDSTAILGAVLQN